MVLGVRLMKSLNGGSKSSRKQKGGKFDSNYSDSYKKHGENEVRKSLSTEKKFARKDRESDFKTFERRPINRRNRDVARDDSDDDNSYRKYSGSGGRRNSFGDKKIAGRGREDVRKFGRRPINGNQRDFAKDDSNEETRSLRGTRELRGPHGKRDGRRGVKIPLRSEVIDQLRSRGKSMGWKRRDINGDDSEGRAPVRPMRRDRRSYARKEEIDESVDSVEASSDKMRLKWKKMDKKQKDTDGNDSHQGKGKKLVKGDVNEEQLQKGIKSEDGGLRQKVARRQLRVLDKYGKKIRVWKTGSDDDSMEKVAPAKKKKRGIKIDPYDMSNKRLDDSAPLEDKSAEKDSEISKNAQFRAIQPSPSILSFVEDKLLGRRRLNELKDAGYNIKLSAPLDNVPFSTSTERERIEENVFRNKLEFFAAAKVSSSFPPPVIPEIAFAGRSNVGKSSLLNALTRQWGVVRTSDKPGLTQTINFFSLASKLCLVDLPGYGFAYAKEEVKDAWEELVKEYVSSRVGLQRVCLLIDTKWGMKPGDYELIDLMERHRTPYQIVLTKTDLVFPIDVARRAMQIQENLKKNKSVINPLAMASSKYGAGVSNLRSILAKITRFAKP